jgi:hypothetical protein
VLLVYSRLGADMTVEQGIGEKHLGSPLKMGVTCVVNAECIVKYRYIYGQHTDTQLNT